MALWVIRYACAYQEFIVVQFLRVPWVLAISQLIDPRKYFATYGIQRIPVDVTWQQVYSRFIQRLLPLYSMTSAGYTTPTRGISGYTTRASHSWCKSLIPFVVVV